MDAPPVTVEVHLANGLPNFTIVGLPEAEVKESKDRVRTALQNARFEFPARRITVNLAPADLPRKAGVSTCPWRWAYSPLPGKFPPTGLQNTNSLESLRSPANYARFAAPWR